MKVADKIVAYDRIENIARKVYRSHKDALYMLINDLEEFFEINSTDINKLTSEEFNQYIENIMFDGK